MESDAKESIRPFLVVYVPLALLGSGYCAAQITGYSGLPTDFSDALALALASTATLPALLGAGWFQKFAQGVQDHVRASRRPQIITFALITLLYTSITLRAIALSRPPDALGLSHVLVSLQSVAWVQLQTLLQLGTDYGGTFFVLTAALLLYFLLHVIRQDPDSEPSSSDWIEPGGWLFLFLLNPLFDLSAPLLTAFLIAAVVIVLAHTVRQKFPDFFPNWFFTLAIPIAWGVGQPLADTPTKLFLLNAFVVLIWCTLFFGGELLNRHKFLLLAVAISLCQLAAATWSVQVAPPEEATLILNAPTNAYCQHADSESLWLADPGCSQPAGEPSQSESFEPCRRAKLTKIADSTFDTELEFSPFQTGVPGRIQTLACSPDTLWAAFQRAGPPHLSTSTLALSITPDGLPRATFDILGPGVGHSLTVDHGAQALYAAAKNTATIRRHHYPSGTQVALPIGGQKDWISGLRRDQTPARLVLADGTTGQWITEISSDPNTPPFQRSVPLNNIRATGMILDEDAGHLFVSGPWTLDRFDLVTFEHKRRIRTTAGSSRPLYIPQHDLLLIASPMEGTIRVHDAETLAVVQTVDIGVGATTPFITGAGYLIASNASATFAWRLHNFLTRDDS